MAAEVAVEERGSKGWVGAVYKDEEIVGGRQAGRQAGGQEEEPPRSHNWLHCLCRPRAPPSLPICPIHSLKIG